MSDPKTEPQDQNEPSLEDILASIRKIVFENDGEAGAGGTHSGNGNTGNRNTENRDTGNGDTGDEAIAAAASEIAAVESLQSQEDSESIAVEAQLGEPAVREIRPAAQEDPAAEVSAQEVPAAEDPPEDVPSPGSQPGSQEAVAAGERPGAASAEPVGQVTAGEPDAGDPVLVLTEMIAPDGSLVRIDPAGPPVEGGPPAQNEHLVQDEGPLRPEIPGQGENPALDTRDQRELAATLREWLDNNLPGIVDRAARDELRKLADRLEGTPTSRQD